MSGRSLPSTRRYGFGPSATGWRRPSARDRAAPPRPEVGQHIVEDLGTARRGRPWRGVAASRWRRWPRAPPSFPRRAGRPRPLPLPPPRRRDANGRARSRGARVDVAARASPVPSPGPPSEAPGCDGGRGREPDGTRRPTTATRSARRCARRPPAPSPAAAAPPASGAPAPGPVRPSGRSLDSRGSGASARPRAEHDEPERAPRRIAGALRRRSRLGARYDGDGPAGRRRAGRPAMNCARAWRTPIFRNASNGAGCPLAAASVRSPSRISSPHSTQRARELHAVSELVARRRIDCRTAAGRGGRTSGPHPPGGAQPYQRRSSLASSTRCALRLTPQRAHLTLHLQQRPQRAGELFPVERWTRCAARWRGWTSSKITSHRMCTSVERAGNW